ncbi:hypothetical protein [Paenibacillus sp. MMO-177]|uniref:hypothetical protein n=1 Tax=Paenibacillus sp. MMO-177 TaxID=3081289 RepID=UPI003016DA01
MAVSDYVCVKKIRSVQGSVLFSEGAIYSFDEKMMTKDDMSCLRNFSKEEKLMKEHFKLKEEELPWL